MKFEIKINGIDLGSQKITINSYDTFIEVKSDCSSSSVVTYELIGTPTPYTSFIPFIDMDELMIFKTRFIIPSKLLDELHKQKVYYLYFYIDGVPATKTGYPIYFDVNTLLLNRSKTTTQLMNIASDINLIKRTLSEKVVGTFKQDPLKYNPPIGTSPIVVDKNGGVVWDFPNKRLNKKIRELAKVVANITELNSTLTERVNTLEKELHDLKFKEYEL